MNGSDVHATKEELADKWQFLRFLLVGGTAAFVNIVSRVIISQFIRFEIAVVVAYLVGMTVAFVLSRMLVFKATSRSVWDEYSRFFLVNLVALAQVWLVSVGLSNWLFPAVGWTFHAELIAHTIAVGSPVFTSYYAHKLFTFR